jgi:predicted nuclease with TOPRIM domain
MLAYTLSDYLRSINVDLSKVEESLADKVEALTTKVDELQERLEAYDESIEEATNAKAKQRSKASSTSSAGRKAKPRAKK